ncbi:MAG: autotransporter domain-containing protein [Hyphomicrobiales bacterium]|nr:autotransporter domain-containing protein [Hyphomicrobiales bacterium]
MRRRNLHSGDDHDRRRHHEWRHNQRHGREFHARHRIRQQHDERRYRKFRLDHAQREDRPRHLHLRRWSSPGEHRIGGHREFGHDQRECWQVRNGHQDRPEHRQWGHRELRHDHLHVEQWFRRGDYQGHAEAGYRWGLPAGGVNFLVTPYAALDYVNAHISGFSETGGFGALLVNAADGNSFQTTLGVRLTSRIAFAGYGTIIPEVRLGWSHEFLDASQQITAALVGVPGSSFSATGIAFGRDAALIGAGFSMELSPEARSLSTTTAASPHACRSTLFRVG